MSLFLAKKASDFFLTMQFVLQTTLIKKYGVFVFLAIFFLSNNTSAQSIIKGKISDEHHLPVPYASVSVKNSVDGTTSDSTGFFSLPTSLTGDQLLIVTAVGYQPGTYPVIPGRNSDTIKIVLKSNTRQLGGVVITAGTIEATDDRLLTIVKPVDILSNASSQGDIIGAFQNMPGVQRNGGDQTGLFVRGGDATETMAILDGTTVQNPFFSSVPGVGQRSRFNPFQIKGMAFSTGGYSARYGQALSSVLDLQTTDLPDKTNVSLGTNIAGLMLSGAKRMENSGLEFAANYTNFGPYYSLAKTNYDFFKKPESAGLSARWIAKTGNKGLFKFSAAYNASNSGTNVPDPNDNSKLIPFDLHNINLSFNASFKYHISDRLKLFTAAGFSNNSDHILWGDTTFTRGDRRLQGRVELSYIASNYLKITTGGEVQHYYYRQQFDTLAGNFTETLLAGFAEAEYQPFLWLAIKPGLRSEYSELLKRSNIAPRLALALRTGDGSQFGLASGLFYQTAPTQYLLLGYRPSFEQVVHYLVNYEWIQNNRSFRIEGYYKNYAQLVREQGAAYTPNPYRTDLGMVDNSGHGYAKGFDLFWRDKASVKNIDYWITYSYVDTKRLYQNYMAMATPDFISTNNLNLIVKYYSEKLHTAISAAYNYASGRPYYNPSSAVFLGDHSPAYQNVSFKVSYLVTFGKVFSAFYVNFDNLTNYKNVLGYRYSADGQQKSPILPPQYFSTFFGVYLSISQFKKDEL